MDKKPGLNIRPLFLLIMAAVIIIRLWLTNGIILQGIPGDTIDDALFISLARNILTTGWLGVFDNFTLVKSPFYPIFLAGSFLLGLPIILAHQLFFILACCVTWLALRPLIRNEWINLLFFTLLVFEPIGLANSVVNRSLREGIFFSLTLLVFSAGIAILLRLVQQKKVVFGWPVLMGLSLGALFLTREERFWMYPFLIFWAVFTIVIAIRRKQSIILSGLSIAIPVLLSSAMMLIVILINGQKYGAYTTIEADIPAYKAAYGALLRVKPPIQMELIPVSKATRELIYSVSPSFKELRPYLEGEVGDAYRNLSANEGSQVEISGAFFNWALNESVARAGYYSQGSYPHEYYRKLAAEINQACNTGELDCYPKRSSLAAPWQPEYLKPTLSNFFYLAKETLILDLMKFFPRGYEGPSINDPAFMEITLEDTWFIYQREQVQGWVVYAGGPVSMHVTTADGQIIASRTRFTLSKDIHEYLLKQGLDLSAAERARFTVTTSCASTCYLEIRSNEHVLARLPIDAGIVSQYADNTDGLYFYIETYNSVKSNIAEKPFTFKLVKHIVPLLQSLYSTYKLFTLPLLLLATVAFLYQTIIQIRRKELSLVWVMSVLAIVLFVSRIAIFAYLRTTSFDSSEIRYLSPLHPLIVIFTFFNCYWFVSVAREKLTILSQRRRMIKRSE
jgi:hypothetical protein